MKKKSMQMAAQYASRGERGGDSLGGMERGGGGGGIAHGGDAHMFNMRFPRSHGSIGSSKDGRYSFSSEYGEDGDDDDTLGPEDSARLEQLMMRERAG